ncbi:MAG: ParB/RepB/Spo0J family partition protein [Acidobacteria bacterium]|nr:ParB/RepB/Spo0J family partition protein [Acidobacteriota bacterium]
MARQPLGRGLSALLGDETPKDSSIQELGIDQIEPNSEQPRSRFEETALDELAVSIKANGIVQPIVVRKNGGGYQIVAGERRWRAAQRAGLRRVPVVVREVADEKLLEIALIENIQRQELNPVEEARAFRKLIDSIGLTQEMVSTRIGKSRTMITTSLRLLKLPDEILDLIEHEKITAGHARALLMTEDAAAQRRVAKTIVAMSLSVRETERMIRKESKQSLQAVNKTRVKSARDANLISAETKLRRKLGTNVNIIPSRTGVGGKVEIEYYSMDDLDRVYQTIIEAGK